MTDIFLHEYVRGVAVDGLIQIYRCLGDETRLRILNLLMQGPLCVCHFQEVLRLPQVAVSKHLAYLRTHGLVAPTRHGPWMIYRLPECRSVELDLQLRCLQDCVQAHPMFQEDLSRLGKHCRDATRRGPGTRQAATPTPRKGTP